MQKSFYLEGVPQPISITRRKGSKSLKLSIKCDGTIKLNVPYGIPELFARRFANDKIDWIKKHSKPIVEIENGSHIGKAHRLKITHTDNERSYTTLVNDEIKVRLPAYISSYQAQIIIKKACEKALQYEAENLLPQKLQQLGNQFQIKYKSCTIKKLKSRWGACDNYGNITLNNYLIQLPWFLIEYVICHELAHTKHHHHKASFWQEVEKMVPDYKNYKKQIKTFPTDIIPT